MAAASLAVSEDIPELVNVGEYRGCDIDLSHPKRDKFAALCSTIEDNPFSHLAFPQMTEVDLEEAKLEAFETKFGREKLDAWDRSRCQQSRG